MKFFLKLSILILATCNTVTAGNDNTHYGARSAGMAHASVGFSSVWSTHHNQAGLAWMDQAQAGVFFQNRFLLKETNYMGMAFALPTSDYGTIGLSFTNFGYTLYSESKVGLAYALKFNSKISGGVQLNYHSTRIGNNYGNYSGVSMELGLQAYLSDDLKISAHLFNPTRTQLAEYNNETIPTVIRMGLNYNFSKQVLGVFEAEKDLLNKPAFKAGLEYATAEKLFLRAGVSTGSALASFGFGYKASSLELDVAASYHQVLGFSPEISINYSFGKKVKDS